MSGHGELSSSLSTLVGSVINRGAYAGALAACDYTTTPRQVQSLLEVAGAYTGDELYSVLVLYVLYKIGRNAIGRLTGNQLLKDLEWLYTVYDGLKRSLGNKVEASFDEIVRKYLGAFKWSFIAIRNTRSYYICREITRIPPNVHEIVKRLIR